MVRKEELEKKKKGMRLGKYELGRTLGEGNFGKVKLARNVETGQYFAIKIIEKNRVIELKITDQVSHSFFLFFSLLLSIFFVVLKWVPIRKQNEKASDRSGF